MWNILNKNYNRLNKLIIVKIIVKLYLIFFALGFIINFVYVILLIFLNSLAVIAVFYHGQNTQLVRSDSWHGHAGMWIIGLVRGRANFISNQIQCFDIVEDSLNRELYIVSTHFNYLRLVVVFTGGKSQSTNLAQTLSW